MFARKMNGACLGIPPMLGRSPAMFGIPPPLLGRSYWNSPPKGE